MQPRVRGAVRTRGTTIRGLDREGVTDRASCRQEGPAASWKALGCKHARQSSSAQSRYRCRTAACAPAHIRNFRRADGQAVARVADVGGSGSATSRPRTAASMSGAESSAGGGLPRAAGGDLSKQPGRCCFASGSGMAALGRPARAGSSCASSGRCSGRCARGATAGPRPEGERDRRSRWLAVAEGKRRRHAFGGGEDPIPEVRDARSVAKPASR